MIDLTGLKPLSDVVIRTSDSGVSLLFAAAITEEIKDSLVALRTSGLFVFYNRSQEVTILTRRLYDPLQIGEKLASYLEGQGLKVSRLIPDPSETDRSSSLEIQSFILA